LDEIFLDEAAQLQQRLDRIIEQVALMAVGAS
jgi:hypothetical protein